MQWKIMAIYTSGHKLYKMYLDTRCCTYWV